MVFTTFHRSERIGYFFAFLAAAMFGSVSTIAKPLLVTVNPLLLSSMVYLVSAATLTPLASRAKLALPTRKDYLLILTVAISGAVIAPSLYFVGLQHASASDTAVLSNGEALFTVLLAMLFFKEKVRPMGYAAIMLILAGMFIVTTNLEFSTIFSQIHFEDMLIISSTIFWAADNNLSRILAKKIEVAKIVQIKSAIGGTLLFAIAVFVFKVPINIEISQIFPILLLGVVGFAASLYFFLQALKRINTVRTVMIFSQFTIFGLMAASLVLNERISLYQGAAAAIMIFGVYLLNRKGITA